MIAERHKLFDLFSRFVSHTAGAARYVTFEFANSLREAFLLARRLTDYSLENFRRWRLEREIIAAELLIGESALATGQGDEAIRLELSVSTLAKPKDHAHRQARQRVLRRLAADMNGRALAGETAELLRSKSIKETSVLELTTRLRTSRSLLLPEEHIARRRAMIGTIAVVAVAVVFFASRSDSSVRNDAEVANFVPIAESVAPASEPMSHTMPIAQEVHLPVTEVAHAKLFHKDVPSGRLTTHRMLPLTESLNIVISLVAMSPDSPGSHDLQGLYGLVIIYDSEDSPNRNNVRFAKLILHAGTDQFRLLLPDLEGDVESMRYAYKDMDARKLHSFLYRHCVLDGQRLTIETGGAKFVLTFEDQAVINALAVDVADRLRDNGYVVSVD